MSYKQPHLESIQNKKKICIYYVRFCNLFYRILREKIEAIYGFTSCKLS